MKTIFEQGTFNAYQERSLQHAMNEVAKFSAQTTVFISHKHDDLGDLQGVLGFLEKSYNVKVYIDSRDSSMPAITSELTANNIKSRIEKCDKFNFLQQMEP